MSGVEDLRLSRAIGMTLILLLAGTFVHAKIIYVDDDAVGANNGTSWPDAYNYLAHALSEAVGGEEIRVAQGIYRPNQGLMAIPEFDWRAATFELAHNLTLRGGYAGLGEMDPNAWDAALYETVLSGDLEADDPEVSSPSDLSDEMSRTNNSYHVLTITGPVILEGIVVVGGHATGPTAAGGGGLWVTGEGVVIRNCVFKGNFAVEGGGAIFGDKADLLLESCTFYGNSAAPDRGVGGGLMLQEIHAVLADCVFSENRAAWGGAVHSSSTRHLEAINCVMTANTALSGGGVFYTEGGLVRTQNCTAAGNVATEGNFLMDVTAPVRGKPAPWIEVDSCILADVGNEISNSAAALTIKYTDLVAGNSAVSDPHRTVVWGPDNIEADPLFAEAGYWVDLYDPNLVVEPNDPNAVWIGGDYHLQSLAGRYDLNSEDWVQDEASSPCIDTGNPVYSFESEIAPNGIRVNMGAYGGTAQAGKSDYNWQFVTTRGMLLAEGLGVILPHEHIFTDLRGPTTPGYAQADPTDVVRIMSPYLVEALGKGIGLLIECSSIGVGRNVPIISQVAEASGLPVVVPTGVYGRGNFAPPEHRNMTEDELAALFTSEIVEGIEGAGIKAGFIKIATDSGAMTPLMERILRAAGRAAVETGAAVASHTPTGSNAIRQVEILRSINPAIRFIWVHAQNESNRNVHRQVAALGGYIEFDNLGWNPGQDLTHIAAIRELLDAGHGDRILLSHDAGWYRPGVSNGGTQKPYTYLVEIFVPKLRSAGIDDATIRMITETNPIRAFGFKSGR